MPNDLTLEQIQALVTRAPFHQWLGLTCSRSTDDSIEISAKWREEWVVNIERALHPWRHSRGADRSRRRLGDGEADRPRRADHRYARRLSSRRACRGDLIARGKVVRAGSQFATAEAQIFDLDGKLIASGRGTYFTAPPKPA